MPHISSAFPNTYRDTAQVIMSDKLKRKNMALTASGKTGWPTFRVIPIIKQQYLPRNDIIKEYNSKRWYEYLTDGAIIFVWIWLLGIVSYFIAMWSTMADGGGESFLVSHFDVAMIGIFGASVLITCVSTILMIRSRRKCGSFILASDQEAEQAVITRHSSQSDITDVFHLENGHQTIPRYSTARGSLFQYNSQMSLDRMFSNVYNVNSSSPKLLIAKTPITPIRPYQSPDSFKRLEPAGCCETEPQKQI